MPAPVTASGEVGEQTPFRLAPSPLSDKLCAPDALREDRGDSTPEACTHKSRFKSGLGLWVHWVVLQPAYCARL